MGIEELNYYIVKVVFNNESTKTITLPGGFSETHCIAMAAPESNNVNVFCRLSGTSLMITCSASITGNVHVQIIKS